MVEGNIRTGRPVCTNLKPADKVLPKIDDRLTRGRLKDPLGFSLLYLPNTRLIRRGQLPLERRQLADSVPVLAFRAECRRRPSLNSCCKSRVVGLAIIDLARYNRSFARPPALVGGYRHVSAVFEGNYKCAEESDRVAV